MHLRKRTWRLYPLSACPTETKWSQWIHGSVLQINLFFPYYYHLAPAGSCSQRDLQRLYFSLAARPSFPFALYTSGFYYCSTHHTKKHSIIVLKQSHNETTEVRDLVKAELTLKSEKVAASHYNSGRNKDDLNGWVIQKQNFFCKLCCWYTTTYRHFLDSAHANLKILFEREGLAWKTWQRWTLSCRKLPPSCTTTAPKPG